MSRGGQAGFDFNAPEHAPERAPTAPQPTDADRRAWLRLARTPGVGPARFNSLLSRCGSAMAALAACPAFSLTPPSDEAIAQEVAAAKAAGARLLRLGEPSYPELLARIDAAPPVLWALGDPARLAARSVAIVGARNASALGRRFAEELARDLAEAGVMVVSGLARGIDAAAHSGSLSAGDQTGAAVVAGGVDHVYPPENAELHRQLSAQGVVLSEMPMGATPLSRHFPRRNRLVSGLSLGVVVVEAAERSGSLITARYAVEQGREAMAAPGRPYDGRAGGCNALLRQGAVLIRGAEDVLEAIAGFTAAPRRHAPPPAPLREAPPAEYAETPASQAPADASIEARILAALGTEPVDTDTFLRSLDLTAAEAAPALLYLELSGKIEKRPGGMIALGGR